MQQTLEQYRQSPLEAAFDEQVKEGFKASLQAPNLEEEQGDLVRISKSTKLGSKVVRFNYTRFDPIRSHVNFVLLANEQKNPSLGQEETTGEWKQLREERDALDGVWGDIYLEWGYGSMLTRGRDHNEKSGNGLYLDAIRKRITDAGGHRLDLAVTDPNYYIESGGIKRWPELYQFAIYQEENPDSSQSTDEKYFGQKADILGQLRTTPQFKGVSHFYRTNEDRLEISYPRLEGLISRSYARVYGSHTSSSTIDPEFVDWSPTSEPFNHRFFLDHHQPRTIMVQLGSFIFELCE